MLNLNVEYLVSGETKYLANMLIENAGNWKCQNKSLRRCL